MKFKLVSALLVCAYFAVTSSASLLHFDCITQNSTESSLIAENQLSLGVLKVNEDTVQFTFANTGPEQCTISEIYIDDVGYLKEIHQIDNLLKGVKFLSGAAPKNLPGGNDLTRPFIADEYLSIQAKNPSPKNGIGNNEWLTVSYKLNSQTSYDEFMNALRNGNVRVGMHVQSFDNGQSESLVASESPDASVPEPSTVILLGLGGLMLGKKRSKNKTLNA